MRYFINRLFEQMSFKNMINFVNIVNFINIVKGFKRFSFSLKFWLRFHDITGVMGSYEYEMIYKRLKNQIFQTDESQYEKKLLTFSNSVINLALVCVEIINVQIGVIDGQFLTIPVNKKYCYRIISRVSFFIHKYLD